MPDPAGATTTLHDGPLALRVTLAMDGPESVRVRYRLDNGDDAAWMVFDRGHRQAVLTRRQRPGAIAAPSFEEVGGGDVVLRHVASSPAGGFTGPTLPATPLALRLDPDASLEGEFAFAIPATTPPRRVRWCLGVAPFDAEAFLAPETVAAGSLWQAGDGAARAQRTLCTPWFDVAARAFQPG